MLGEKETPELNYHQDTKLLIAVGEMSKLGAIDSLLQELAKGLGPSPQVNYGQPQGVTVVPPPVGTSPRL
jgi:hypothetical protein